MAASDFEVTGSNAQALFTLKIHRGEGMALLAMNWKNGKPADNFVGFAIEYQEPGGAQFYALKNRLSFPGVNLKKDPTASSTLRSPIQKFRWVHFPRNAELPGLFTYRVTPVFMNASGELSQGAAQTASLELRRETYPGELNLAFTRGFVSSQAFVDRYVKDGPISELLPGKNDDALTFKPTHKDAADALPWMGFEARSAILELLDKAIADPAASVRMIAYDFDLPELLSRLKSLGSRLRIIIDDSVDKNGKGHGETTSDESAAAKALVVSAGATHVKRQKMGRLQHNKFIVVDGPTLQAANGGSTNFSWRGFYVQNNHTVVLRGATAIAPFAAAFESYWQHDDVSGFGHTPPATWTPLGFPGIDAEVAFSPHVAANAVLADLSADIQSAKSSLFYSFAFLYQTPGLQKTLRKVIDDPKIFVYGISDKRVGGLELQLPKGRAKPVYPKALTDHVPQPFKAEPEAGGGARMHHKFVVIDPDLPTARVYFGSYNFSNAADGSNGENLFRVRDRRIAVAFMIEALRIFDHYEFRVLQSGTQGTSHNVLELKPAPKKKTDKIWWAPDWSDPLKIRDRELFA